MLKRKNKINALPYELYNMDAIEQMKLLKTGSVNLVAADLPYGITKNKWDIPIPIDEMWIQFKRLVSPTGVIVLTAAQPFSSLLVVSNLDMFKYDLIWEKTISSGQLNVKKQPMRNHESLLIFGGPKSTYNEQKTEGKPYTINRKANYKNDNYNKQTDNSKINTGYRHAKSVIRISNPRIRKGHPTQKPLELFNYIINAYSNPSDTVLDCCMGSGTTGVSSIMNGRKFIGIELDTKYYTEAHDRIKATYETI
jgi:site-specific DNA-methyltransferase (adenine-specific)